MFSSLYSLSIVLLAVSIPSILCFSEEENARWHKICQDETGVPEALIEAADKGDFKDDESLKCYMKCFMHQIGVVSDEGIVDVEGLISWMPENKKDKVGGAIRTCGTKIGKDLCDNIFLTHKCYFKECPEHYFLI